MPAVQKVTGPHPGNPLGLSVPMMPSQLLQYQLQQERMLQQLQFHSARHPGLAAFAPRPSTPLSPANGTGPLGGPSTPEGPRELAEDSQSQVRALQEMKSAGPRGRAV